MYRLYKVCYQIFWQKTSRRTHKLTPGSQNWIFTFLSMNWPFKERVTFNILVLKIFGTLFFVSVKCWPLQQKGAAAETGAFNFCQWRLYGMLWYDMVCNGMPLYVMVCYFMLWYAMVLYVTYAVASYDTLWNGMGWFAMLWYGVLWYDMVCYGLIWYAMVWYGMLWYDLVCYGMIWYGMLWYDKVC